MHKPKACLGCVVSFRLTWPPEGQPVPKKQSSLDSIPIYNPSVDPFVTPKDILQSTISSHLFGAKALDLHGSAEVALEVFLLPSSSLELFSQLLTIRTTSDPLPGTLHLHTSPPLPVSAPLPPGSPLQPFYCFPHTELTQGLGMCFQYLGC